ncbi:techylectin-5A-like [Mytilus edulis]|uniref:techylectin-5A-like n=1 Tax=Mytilus edulis TaxID=6550 RepID=UPI0039EFF501
MHRKLLLAAFLLIFEQSDGHEISKDERVAEVSDKVAKRITKRTSPCEDLGFRPSDCGDLKKSKYKSGIYKIYPDRSTGFYVYCDMRNYGGGWTVFQRRTNGYVGFYRDWRAYNEGFGNLKADFWLGNEYLSKLTQQGYYILRIDMWDFHYNHRYAIYNTFVVKNEMSGYKLEVAKYTGNAGDSLSEHNGYRFSTWDRDNDVSRANCAERYKGGWWYNKCHRSNLNGKYLNGYHSSYADGVNWYDWKGYHYSLKRTRMMIRRV